MCITINHNTANYNSKKYAWFSGCVGLGFIIALINILNPKFFPHDRIISLYSCGTPEQCSHPSLFIFTVILGVITLGFFILSMIYVCKAKKR